MSVTAVPNYSGGNDLLVFFQTNGWVPINGKHGWETVADFVPFAVQERHQWIYEGSGGRAVDGWGYSDTIVVRLLGLCCNVLAMASGAWDLAW